MTGGMRQWLACCAVLREPLTFPAAAELDGDLLVHVLAQVEDVLFLGPLRLSAGMGSPAASTSAAATASWTTVASSATASAAKSASLRHCVSVGTE